jgi:adenine-specific DNA-methyltransferase
MAKKNNSIEVESIKHQDKRKNIPTEELRDFVKEDENKPEVILYPRDSSLDPQLVWKGKDEQDQQDLAVPAVPIYIQEKIHPQAIIEDIRREYQKEAEPQASLFADFNGLDWEQQIEFYQHESNWSNRMILGDSLYVMTSLAEKEGLKGQVQMIYIDPPYGIKFGSNWQVSTRKKNIKDGKAEDTTRQPEQVRAFRDTWRLGIHSYLAYFRDRLQVVRELLTDSGCVFVQINSENAPLLRLLLDEAFGSENFVADIIFRKKSIPLGAKFLETMHDHLLFYSKDYEQLKFRHLFEENDVSQVSSHGPYAMFPDENWAKIPVSDFQKKDHPQGTRYYRLFSLLAPSYSEPTDFPFEYMGKSYPPPSGGAWVVNESKLRLLADIGRIQEEGKSLSYRLFYDDFPYKKRTSTWYNTQVSYTKSYVVQTAPDVVARCLLMTTDPGDLVLDPTCGSGTTAYVAEQWGRRWITVDTSRVSLALARTRIMAAKYPYYLLADSKGGIAKESEITGKFPPDYSTTGDIRKGFVYNRVPHITLKAIANNTEIDVIYEKYQKQLEPIRRELNKLLKKKWEDWEVPRELDVDWPKEAEDIIYWKDHLKPYLADLEDWLKSKTKDAKDFAAYQKQFDSFTSGLSGLLEDKHKELEDATEKQEAWRKKAKELLDQWWDLRRQRQEEIDASIARNADQEILYDQPYEDNKRVRVSGPFTCESLSPHRVLSTDEKLPETETNGRKSTESVQFETMILDNLKKAGVQNTIKNERLKFDRLEPFAGTWVQAQGQYTEKDGTVRRAAVSIGPEHATVGPQLVKEAAKEAVKGVGFDLLIICGFAFDPHVSEEAKRYGELTVLPCRMNADLSMGDELLKKTGAGNLFMIFGEPDIDIAKAKDKKITVKFKGLDIYDPTTGQIRSNSTDDIACWFIDTSYNEESFFVRHAYFTGGDEPYDKLKRALRAEIDEAAWSALYSTQSRPFDPPATGKIAIKVINHYGDEVLKVYEV